MPSRLVDLDVQFISLVEFGANKRQILFKSADHDDKPAWEKQVVIAKVSQEKQMVYGIVYAPDEVDTQGDYATAEDIEQASYNFMKTLRVWQVDKDHSFENEAAFVAESWLVKSPDTLFPDEKDGAWAVGIKIEEDSLWGKIKDGSYRALSLAGFANRVNVEKNEGLFQQFCNWLKSHPIKERQRMIPEEFKKTVEEAMAPLATRLEALEGKEVLTNADLDAALSEGIKKALQPFQADLETLKSESPGTKQDNEPLQKENEDKLVTQIVKYARQEG